jgi:carboxyl-terminal processing protease
MMKRYTLFIFAALMLVATACRDHSLDLTNPNNVTYTKPSEQFQAIWNGINNSYAFWDIDPTDWDAIYDEYLPLFYALDDLATSGDTIPTEKLKSYYTEICRNFIDHHMAIWLKNQWHGANDEQKIKISPSTMEAKTRNYYHERYGDSLVINCVANLANTEYVYACDKEKNSILVANIDGVAYMKLSGYMLTEMNYKSDSLSVAIMDAYEKFYEMLQDDDLKGVILDNRGNGGGYVADLNYVITPFIDGDLKIGDTRRKEGLGRYDYSPWIPFIVRDNDSLSVTDVTVVALADLNSVSMGEITTYAISLLPNGCVVGERTWGGNGPLLGDFDINYGGTFGDRTFEKVSHFVYTSTDVLRLADGEIHEGKGITPNIEVLYDDDQMQAGTDVQLNAALDYILR